MFGEKESIGGNAVPGEESGMDDENKTTTETPADGTKRPPSRGRLILGMLASPAVLSFLVLLVVPGEYGLNAFLPLLLCPVVGIVAGVLVASGLQYSTQGERLLVGFFLVIGFTIASASLAFSGCMLVSELGIFD